MQEKSEDMGTWEPGTFDNDAALDFINEEIDRHISAIEAIFADGERFCLDEDAEGELMPRVEILILLCESCHGVLPEELDSGRWKAQYLEMYDDQINGLEPSEEYKRQRRISIAATFDRLIRLYEKQRQRNQA